MYEVSSSMVKHKSEIGDPPVMSLTFYEGLKGSSS